MARSVLLLCGALVLAAGACTRTREQAAPADAAPATPPAPASSHPVQVEMRNVNLHVDEGIVLRITHLRGEMVSTRPGQPPVFDDQRSYLLRLFGADISIDMTSLGNLMNRHVFGYAGAPLKDISVQTDGRLLEQKGKLEKGVSLPFTLKASVATTPDGRLRLHAESVSALGLPAKKLMDIFGLSLDDLVNIKQRRGVEIEGDDIIIAPGRVLPPPEIQGHLARVDLVNGALHQVFATPGRDADGRLAPPDTPSPNYVCFSGSDLRFGRLLMSNADLIIVDADPKDPFDFFPAQYHRQLVAGYSKNTPAGGLRTYLPDFNDLASSRDLRPSTRQKATQGTRQKAEGKRQKAKGRSEERTHAGLRSLVKIDGRR